MADGITPNKTRVALTPVQIFLLIGTIVSATLTVSAQLNGIKGDIADLKESRQWEWNVEDMRGWVYEATRENAGKGLMLPYPAKAAKPQEAIDP